MASEETSTYHINGGSVNTLIFDVTHPTQPVLQPFTLENNTLVFSDSSNEFKAYVAFEGNGFSYPIFFGNVANQNIRSLSPRDGIIISDNELFQEASRLAQFHRDHDGLDVEVISLQQIYNEFSSGMQDITAIRDAVRNYWKKNKSFRYVTLFGACSYDYKNRVFHNTNRVPIYQSRISLDPIYSYSSDDYYGFMEEDEGYWHENRNGDHTLEIGIGRLPVNNIKEAKNMVDKIINYATNIRTLGEWKNKVAYVVDDGDNNIHLKHAEALSAFLNDNIPYTSTEKLYIDAFEQEVNGDVQTSNTTKNGLKQLIDDGTFLINYIGHGTKRDGLLKVF